MNDDSFVCVGCGEPVETLFVEYSAQSIKLTRCARCGRVADKYIEYEVVLVLIDIVLHRKPAYRHLLFNRLTADTFKKSVRLLPLSVIATTTALRIIVLRSGLYHNLTFPLFVHALLASIAEHLVLLSVVTVLSRSRRFLRAASFPSLRNSSDNVAGLAKMRASGGGGSPSTMMSAGSNSGQTGHSGAAGDGVNDSGDTSAGKRAGARMSHIYLATAFPEAFKATAIFLQIFDSDPSMLILFGLVVLSIQWLSLSVLMHADRISSSKGHLHSSGAVGSSPGIHSSSAGTDALALGGAVNGNNGGSGSSSGSGSSCGGSSGMVGTIYTGSGFGQGIRAIAPLLLFVAWTVVGRLGVKICFYTLSDIWQLGIVM